MELTVIAGNGLSIAFSDRLLLAAITERVARKFESLTPDASPTFAAIRTIAGRMEGGEDGLDEDFEKLVGALETQAGLIHALEELIELAPNSRDELVSALETSADFAHRLYDMGTGIVLQDILENSPGGFESTKHLHPFFHAIMENFEERITFANLNYDGLVMSTLRTLDAPMCDIAIGYRTIPITVTNENNEGETEDLGTYDAHPLRSKLDFPEGDEYRSRLVHLHGSVTFWEDRSTRRQIKIPIEVVREHALLSDTSNERRNFRPSVILANSIEKPRRQSDSPFNLGYAAMSEGLANSSHWLIVGYSFRDESVNSKLRNNFMSITKKPTVLVCTHGEMPTRTKIEESLGWGAEDGSSDAWLIVDRSGVQGLESRQSWAQFSGS